MSEINLDGIGPCGVVCFACPSYVKGTCMGCRSNKKQKRTSKLGCKIRKCCLTEKQFQLCSECEEFPCKFVNKKVLTTHIGEKKFAYRHEIAENLQILQEFGIEEGLRKLEERWCCPECGGRIQFYAYTCGKCGKDFLDSIEIIRKDL